MSYMNMSRNKAVILKQLQDISSEIKDKKDDNEQSMRLSKINQTTDDPKGFKGSLIQKMEMFSIPEVVKPLDRRTEQRLMQHMKDFKTKGKLENVILKQYIQIWREKIKAKREKEDYEAQHNLNNILKIQKQQFKQTRVLRDEEDNARKGNTLMIKVDEHVVYNNKDLGGVVKGKNSKVRVDSEVPKAELRRLLPLCNDIIKINIESIKEHQKSLKK